MPLSEVAQANLPLTIDEYLRKKLMPVEGVITRSTSVMAMPRPSTMSR